MNILNKIKVGDKLYCTMFGDVTIIKLCPDSTINSHITIKENQGIITYLDKEGKYTKHGECILFPSKENRNWYSIYDIEEKFDINTLNPFDKVLVRDANNLNWCTGYYSHKEEDMFICAAGAWCQCIPYNEDTKHLVGTYNMPDSYYITWQ